jgi:mutator protein MutT
MTRGSGKQDVGPRPTVEVVVGVIVGGAGVLVTRRPKSASFGGCWEFPGGKVEAGETATDALHRELLEELGVKVVVEAPLIELSHDYPTKRIRLRAFVCRVLEGEPRPLAATELQWVGIGELMGLRFPPANGPLLTEVERHLRAVGESGG